MKLFSVFPVQNHKVCISKFLLDCISLLILSVVWVLNNFIHLFNSCVFLGFLEGIYSFLPLFSHFFMDFIKGFILFLFEDLYHLYIICFKIFYMCFSYVAIFVAYYHRITGRYCGNITLAVICFIFILVSIHLGLE